MKNVYLDAILAVEERPLPAVDQSTDFLEGKSISAGGWSPSVAYRGVRREMWKVERTYRYGFPKAWVEATAQPA